ncbi:MAG: 5-methylcytosine-specific restriction endonuclease McrBC GTP-binding regulatory subunit McrB [Arenicella sp.]|jgi:5-methylcytosine-specific restriction endonuclease McrBC GTP-binding regulatory subunit McrB
MKFLVKEHKSIVKIFEDVGTDSSKYSFRKKGGQLFIELEGKSNPFCFYRKKESTLNSSMQFEDKITYFIGLKQEIEVDSWEDVLSEIKAWI